MTMRLKALFGLILALALIGAACGDSGSTTTTQATTATTAPPATSAPTTVAPTTVAPTTAPPTTQPPAAMPLLVWADETRVPIVEAVAADFTAATGVPVEIQLVGFGDIRNNMVQQGPVGEGADVFIGAHDWVGELAVNGVVEPIDLGARSGEFFPVALDAFSFGGNLYGVPYAVEAIGLYRNTDLVPDAPASFEDLLGVCDTLGNTVTTCLALPAGGDAFHHYPFLASPGGYIFRYDPATGYDVNDVGLDNAGAIEGLGFLDTLVKDGVANPDVDYGAMTNQFFAGDAAFMWTGPWALPDVQASGVPYAVSKLPTINGNTARPFVGVQGFMVNAFSEQKTLAQTFVLDFIATEQVMVDLYNAGLRAPAHISSFDQVASDPDVQAFGASGADGNPMPNVPEMAAVWGALGDAVAGIYNQSDTVANLLANAATQVRDSIASS